MTRMKISGCVAVLIACCLAVPAEAQPAKFGLINPTMVPIPANFKFPRGLQGYRVTRVRRGSVADQMGLEKGDIVISVDGFFFKNEKAFDWIMKGVGKTAKVGVIDVRTGRLVYIKARFNHTPDRNRGRPPRGIAAKAVPQAARR